MATIILRQANVVTTPGGVVKGSPLTNSEVDNNFANVNVELSDLGNTVAGLSTFEISNANTKLSITVADGPLNLTGNIIPTSDNVFSLGSPSNVFADLFLSGNSLHLGSLVLSVVSGNIALNGNQVLSSTGGATPADGTITADKLSTDSVTADKIATDAVTNAKVVANAITEAKIADAAVTTVKLSTTGVAAAAYGNATLIPTFTVGVDGRITAAGNVAIEASGGGSGLFNTAISEAVGYAITDTFANAYNAPSTVGNRYIIHSIHVTNISEDLANVTGQFVGATYANISFADTLPVPVGSAVELIKKPKILQPDDHIQFLQEGAGNLHATITVEESTESEYFGAGIDITTTATYQDLYVATANAVIESVLLSNDDSGELDVKATVVYTDGSDVIQGYFSFELIVPYDATVEILEQPKFLESGYKVRVQANQADRLEAIIAGKTV